MVTRRAVGLVLVAGVLLSSTGCTGGTDGASPSPQEPTVSASPEPEVSQSVSHSFELGGHSVDLEVGPVVVGDGYATLPVVARTIEGSADAGRSVSLDTSWGDPRGVTVLGPDAVRLVHPDDRAVSLVAQNSDGSSVVSSQMVFLSAEPEALCMVFATPPGGTVDVLLPYAGYVAEVPVVPADEGGALLREAGCELSELTESAPTDLTLPVIPLDTYVEQLGGDVRTRTETDAVTVAVSADVLFATDSAELGPVADEALTVAGEQIADFAGGELVIVGHTDDVASHAYNDELSVRRAQSVADRLAELMDVSAYEVTVDGRGKREPVASGTSDEARAANRRVELTFTPAAGADITDDTHVAEPTGEMPDAEGPEGTGGDGVRITDYQGRAFLVRIDEVRRTGPYMVGELTVERVGGDGVWGIGGLFSSGALDGRGSRDPHLQNAATNLTLLVGSTRYYPLDYVRNDRGSRDPLSDRYLGTYIDEGRQQTVTVVWPDVPGGTVTIDAPAVIHAGGVEIGASFRLTDVPVVDG